MSDVKINIRTQGDVSGVQQVNTSVQQLESQAVTLQNQLSLAFNIDLTRRFIDGLTQVAAKLKEAVDRGIAFNATMQDTADAIRAAMVAASEGTLDFDTAQAQATQTTRRLADEANRAAVPIEAYAALFARQAGLASEAGLSMSQWEHVLGDAAVAASNMGMSLGELESRMAQLLSGQVGSRNTFAKALGITQEDMNAAIEAGNVIDYLRDKLSDWQQDVEGLNAAKQRLRNAIDMALGDATVRIFESLEKGIGKVGDSIANIDAQSLDAVIAAMAKAVEVGLNLTAWAADNADAMALLALSVTSYGTALLASKFGPLLASKAKLLTATFTQTKATQANTTAQLQNNAAKLAGVGASGKLAAALTRAGHVGLAAFAGWTIGTMIDDATGASDKLADIWEGLTAKADLSQPLQRTLSNLREQASEMETLQDKEELRNKTIQFRALATRRMNEAIRDGEEEIAAQYENQITGLDRILGALDQALTRNQERIATTQAAADAEAEVTRELTAQEEVQRLINSLDEDALATRDEILASLTREKALLEARISGDEEAIRKAEDAIAIERERQALIRSGVVTEEEATFAASQLVALKNQATTAEQDRREALRNSNQETQRSIDLTRQLGQEEENQRQLRAGVTVQKFTDIDGTEKERFMERGRVLGTSDDFGRTTDPKSSPPFQGGDSLGPRPADQSRGGSAPQLDTAAQPAAPTPAPTPDLSPIAQSLSTINLDTSRVAIAVAQLQARLHDQLADLASQIDQLGN